MIQESEVENKFITLETKFAYLEDFVQQLQDVVVAQQKTLNKLLHENKMISEKLTDLLENSQDIPNRRPPHY